MLDVHGGATSRRVFSDPDDGDSLRAVRGGEPAGRRGTGADAATVAGAERTSAVAAGHSDPPYATWEALTFNAVGQLARRCDVRPSSWWISRSAASEAATATDHGDRGERRADGRAAEAEHGGGYRADVRGDGLRGGVQRPGYRRQPEGGAGGEPAGRGAGRLGVERERRGGWPADRARRPGQPDLHAGSGRHRRRDVHVQGGRPERRRLRRRHRPPSR